MRFTPSEVGIVLAALTAVLSPFAAKFFSRRSATQLLAARDQALNARDDAIQHKQDEMFQRVEAQYRECEESSRALRGELDRIRQTVVLWEAGRLVPDGYRLVPVDPK